MESNSSRNIASAWLTWQFYEMPKFLLQAWKNYILFALNYFSMPLLVKSLFAPWHRYRWVYPRGFDIAQYANVFLSNLVSRFLGALARVALIFVGILFFIFIILAGALIFLGWVLTPLIILAGILFTLYI